MDHTPKHAAPANEHERGQIVYRTRDGLDYCRETCPKYLRTHEDAAAWAVSQFNLKADSNARKVITGFVVEFW